MATVAEIALEQARELLEELDMTDELAYRRRLRRLQAVVLGDLNAYVFMHQTHHVLGTEKERQLNHLLLQRPYPEAAIQHFLEQHIPNWERVVQRGVEKRSWLWIRWLGQLESE